MNLLQRLSELQAEAGWLSPQVLEQVAAREHVSLHRVQEVVSFYPHYRLEPPPRATVRICRDAACHIQGGPEQTRRIRAALADAEGVEIEEVSCIGRCERAPAVSIDDVPLEGWTPAEIAAAAQGEKELPPDEPTRTPRTWPADPYASREEHYGVLRELLRDVARSHRAVPDALEAAGLRGMGGAGFPTGLKWRLVRDQRDPVKWAIVNADESEPGTFKDRVILEELPHLVIEGLLIACVVIRAQHGVVYLRHEYGREGLALRREIDRVRELGLLDAVGASLELFVSPGGYILGEETALIEALEGKRGEPRNKPPFPGQSGVHGHPTLVNNVETYAHVPLILREGGDAWRAHGVRGAHGWKFVSLCGHVERPGVYCVPLGTTVQELIDEHGGGMLDGRDMRAFSPGGASSPFLPAALADTPLDFDALATAGSMLGSGAVLAVAVGTDLVDLSMNIVRFFRNESCGKCVPCRIGTEKAVTILERALDGETDGTEHERLRELEATLRLTSICGLGQVALGPLVALLERFPAERKRVFPGPDAVRS